MTRVSITSVNDDVGAAFARAMQQAGCEGIVRRGDRVLIKPNWNACGIPGSTSLNAVEAACIWAHAQGAGEVVVGEGPVPVGKEAVDAYLKEMDAHECLRAVGARFINFDEQEHTIFRDEKDLPDEVGISEHALACDVMINIPLLKVHSCCLTTLCLKNLKGCLRPQDKMAFHRAGLLPAIVALNRLVRPQINVIDAIDAMEGDHNRGPLVHLGLFIAGRDPVAVDGVGSAMIGLPSGAVPLLKMAGEARLGEYRLDQIEIVGEPLRPRRFELPQDRLERLYPDLDIQDADACSACSAALMDGLYIAGGSGAFRSIAMGSRSRPGPDTLVLGKCLREYWPTHRHVKGCPPSGAKIAAVLQGAEGNGSQ